MLGPLPSPVYDQRLMPTGSQYRDPTTGRIAKAPASSPPSQEDVVLVAEVLDMVDQQMIPGFEEFTKAIQVISKSLDSVSSELSLLNSNLEDLSDNILTTEPVREDSTDRTDLNKMFESLETIAAVSFSVLAAMRELPDKLCSCFGTSIDKDQKQEEKVSAKDSLLNKEKELESGKTKLDKSEKSGIEFPSAGGILSTLTSIIAPFLIGFLGEGGSLSALFSNLMDFLKEAIFNAFKDLWSAIKDLFINLVINPIIGVLNKIPGVDIEPVMTSAEQAAADGTATGLEEAGSTFGTRSVVRAAGIGNLPGRALAAATEKTALKTALKKIPVLGAGAGLLFGAQRALEGDFLGAGLEVASGIAGGSGVGILGGVALDATLAGLDTAGITGSQRIQDTNITPTPSANNLRNNLDSARQTTEEARLRPQQKMGGDVSSVVVGGTSNYNTRTEIIQPPPEAGTDMGIPRKGR
jgi:hypothetical protein